MRHKCDQLPEVGHARAAIVAVAGTTEGSNCELSGSGPAAKHLKVRASPQGASFTRDNVPCHPVLRLEPNTTHTRHTTARDRKTDRQIVLTILTNTKPTRKARAKIK